MNNSEVSNKKNKQIAVKLIQYLGEVVIFGVVVKQRLGCKITVKQMSEHQNEKF